MLTFEAIRELERNEKNSRKLQRLPADIVQKLSEYIIKKENISEKTTSDIIELENVKSTVKRFYELREKKITESALDAARTGMVPENLSPQEEQVFWLLVSALKDQRERFFASLRGNLEIVNGEKKIIEEKLSLSVAETKVIEEKGTDVPQVLHSGFSEDVVIPEPQKPVFYKILRTLPPFVGLDMSIYELKEGDIREIPKPLNELLLKEGVILEHKEE